MACELLSDGDDAVAAREALAERLLCTDTYGKVVVRAGLGTRATPTPPQIMQA